jgi:two-component system phosphate regulon sensor histidine kinase PhoR
VALFNISVKAEHVRILVISIAMSLLTLLALQFYWLNNAIKLQKENFNILANNAVHEITKRIESQEAIGAFLRASLKTAQTNPAAVPPSGLSDLGQEAIPDFSGKSMPNFGHESNEWGDVGLEEDTLATAIDKLVADKELFKNNEFMYAFMLEIQSSRNQDIFQRVSNEAIDSLAQLVFEKYELTREFTYEIVKGDNAFFKRVANENKIAGTQNVFLARLFPGDQLTTSYYLVFRFYNQRAFFFSHVSAQIMLSLLAILLLGGSFYMLVDLLLKQKKLSELKTDFINNMTHELKTPIATINLASEALLEQVRKDENAVAERYNRIIFEENQRLRRHVERILNIALLEKSGFSLKLKAVDLHELVSKAAHQTELMVQKKQGQLQLKLLAGKHVMQLDEMHMLNVLTNLIDNALKYCQRQPEVAIQTSSTDSEIVIEVRDNGIGMTPAQLKKIFEKFYRVPTGDVHDVKGFGLGLSYVQSIIELHGGKVEVQSEAGQGSTFILTIPFEKPENHGKS